MFSGIIEEIGTVQQVDSKKNLSTIKVRARAALKGAKRGASIALDGACLTVTDIKKNTLIFDVIQETLLKTTIGTLKKGERVNLERALKLNGRIDGHFVTGHVDDIGTIKNKIAMSNNTELQVVMTKNIAKYIVPKGSVCLDGVSLTVGEVAKGYFSVYLIPFTKKGTTLGHKKKGDKINIETDIIAKYIVNRKPSGASMKKLKKEIALWN